MSERDALDTVADLGAILENMIAGAAERELRARLQRLGLEIVERVPDVLLGLIVPRRTTLTFMGTPFEVVENPLVPTDELWRRP